MPDKARFTAAWQAVIAPIAFHRKAAMLHPEVCRNPHQQSPHRTRSFEATGPEPLTYFIIAGHHRADYDSGEE